MCNSLDDLSTRPLSLLLSIFILPLVDVPVELDIYSNIVSWKLPGIKVEPVVWNLHLIAIYDLLLEDAISISEPVTPGRVVEGSETVEEARCETAETAVTESSIVLLRNDILHAEAEIGEALLR